MAVGQSVDSIETVLNRAGASLAQGSHHQEQPSSRQLPNGGTHTACATASSRAIPTASSRLARGSAADLALLNKDAAGVAHSQRFKSQSISATPCDPLSLKRKRTESSHHFNQADHIIEGQHYKKEEKKSLMLPPPLPSQQAYVFTNRIDGHHIDSSTSDRDHINLERTRHDKLLPHRLQTPSRNAITEVDPSLPLLGFPPVPPPNRPPLPPIPPASSRDISRNCSSNCRQENSNRPPNRLQLAARQQDASVQSPSRGGRIRADSDTLPLPPGEAWTSSPETFKTSNSRHGLSGNARSSHSQYPFRFAGATVANNGHPLFDQMGQNGRTPRPPSRNQDFIAPSPLSERHQPRIGGSIFRHDTSFGWGPSPVRGGTRPYSSAPGSSRSLHPDSIRRRAQR